MKWLWIGFAIVWALSVVLDGRRRARTSSATSAESEKKSPLPESPLPALLTPRGTH
jgi:hypothetical protein